MTQKMTQNLEKSKKNGKGNKLKSNKKRLPKKKIVTNRGYKKNLQKIVSIRETYQLGG